MYATSPLTLSPVSSQKIDCYTIKICLEYEKRFHVPGVLPYYEAVVLAEAPTSTLLPPLGDMFSPADNSMFISFRDVPGD